MTTSCVYTFGKEELLDSLQAEANSSVFKKKLKAKRYRKGEINCRICPYHKWENATFKIYKNWKKHRKSQYREK